ncbi:MAG: hydroxymethylpyrimidine/phosphomethylpyrimidine kinase, partial [Deltaproteobacteria bacterium]|nr:hydroxymethylpyrimidine/phosphomethylpyrimidine kinase [Deltaproteobacteria bacterium]
MENIKDLRPLCVLTIASSDSGGGAGIQADLKTFAAHGHFGLSAVSGITAQNTLEVLDAEYVTPRLLTAELRAVFADFEVSAIKIGLLGTAENTLAVYYFLKKFEEQKVPVVVDPVMCSSTGHVFLQDDAVFALKTLLKMAYLVTPNLFEARALSGEKVAGFEDYHSAARKIMELGAQNVLIKGGHLTESDSSDDFLLKSDGSTAIFKGRR